MGFSLQSVSPRWSRTPFGARTLMLFPASRAPALRTKKSRCPAAPGLCSPQRSVPAADRSPLRPMLSWDFSPLQSGPHAARTRLPKYVPHTLSPRPSVRAVGGDPGIWRTRGQADPSRDRPALLRFSTRTCPRFLPMTVASCRSNPTGSEWAARTDPAAEAASARFSVRSTRRGCPTELAPREARKVTPPGGPSPHTTLSKRNLRAGRTLGCRFRLRPSPTGGKYSRNQARVKRLLLHNLLFCNMLGTS